MKWEKIKQKRKKERKNSTEESFSQIRPGTMIDDGQSLIWPGDSLALSSPFWKVEKNTHQVEKEMKDKKGGGLCTLRWTLVMTMEIANRFNFSGEIASATSMHHWSAANYWQFYVNYGQGRRVKLLGKNE